MPEKHEDLVLLNGRIYTLAAGSPVRETGLPVAEALLVRQGRIAAVGSSRQLASGTPVSRTGAHRRIDLRGRTVIPGIQDSHTHFLQYSLGLERIDLEGLRTLHETLEKTRQYSQGVAEGGWILGRGWNKNAWPEGRWPVREDLDRVCPRHAVALAAHDGHAWWVNTEALRRTGISRGTAVPAGGEIARDEATGEPTGILKENAIDLVAKAIPRPTVSQCVEALRKGIAKAYALGITGIHEMGDPHALEPLAQTVGEELPFRVTYYAAAERLSESSSLDARRSVEGEFFRIAGVKTYSDGSLGSQTAATFSPYLSDPSNRGMLTIEPEELRELVRKATDAGLASAVHAIGDRAVRIALDAIERAGESARPAGLRHRIEHAQLIDPEDLPRFARLGVVASMQPAHIFQDILPANRHWGERARWAFPFRSLLANSAILAFGSDTPIETLNPLEGIYAAIQRRRLDGSPFTGWHMAEAITAEEALRAYCQGSAWAAGQEGDLGTLEPGKWADFVVLDRDLLAIPAAEIPQCRVLATYVAGRCVYRDTSFEC